VAILLFMAQYLWCECYGVMQVMIKTYTDAVYTFLESQLAQHVWVYSPT